MSKTNDSRNLFRMNWLGRNSFISAGVAAALIGTFLLVVLGFSSLANPGFASDFTSSTSGIITLDIDTIPPSFSANETNASLMRINGNATFNITISDSGSGLSCYIFSWNGTGSWDNSSNGSISGNSVKMVVNKSTSLSRGNTIGYVWYANDSAGNWNNSILGLFTVANTIPTSPAISYPVDGKNYTSIPYINYSGSSDSDGDALTYSVYINGTLNITTTTNITGWNASEGFYNLTVTASDGTDSSENSSVIHFRIDAIPPSFSNNKTNATNLTYNGTAVQLNITISDNIIIDYYRLSHNGTLDGRWINESSIAFGGGITEAVFNYSIKNFSLDGGRFGWRVWANDSAGNANSSLIYSFDIPDRAAPNITSTSPSGTINIYRINISVTTNENAECRFISSSEGNYTTEYSNMSHNFTSLNNTLSHYSNLTLANGDYLYYARCIDNSGNVMNSSSNISFTIYTETSTVTSGGGGGGGRAAITAKTAAKVRLASINLINPGPLSLLTMEEADILLYLENRGEIPLKNISISAVSNTSDAVLKLSESYVDMIPVNRLKKVTLNIKSTSLETFGKYPIVITAKVDEPRLETTTKTYINIIDRYAENKTQFVSELGFAKDLFRENPECLEFGEFLKQAEEALDNYEFGRSLSIMRGAIQACRDTISPAKEEKELPASKEKAGNLLIFIVEVITASLLAGGIFVYIVRRNKRH